MIISIRRVLTLNRVVAIEVLHFTEFKNVIMIADNVVKTFLEKQSVTIQAQKFLILSSNLSYTDIERALILHYIFKVRLRSIKNDDKAN